MKRFITLILSILILLDTFSIANAAPQNMGAGVRTIKIGNYSKTVNVVTIDLNGPDMKLEVVTANDRVSGSEDFMSMIDRRKPAAAINANFFDAYDSLEPYGSIMKNKELTYLEGENTSLVISEKNKVDIDYFKAKIDGYLDGKRENNWNNERQAMDFNLFSVWYVNNLPKDNTGVYMYTPKRGKSIWLDTGTAIEVIQNKITKITKNPKETAIPSNGYIIYYGANAANDKYINDRFWIGRTVELNYTASAVTKKVKGELEVKAPALSAKQTKPFGSNTEAVGIDINKVDYMISAGPYLVKDGKIIVDAIAQGFKEDKIVVNRAQRSAIGITKDNKLMLVTGGNLNMTELAQVMMALGCNKAMNLDGGASSGLYAKGKMITKPGRKLNTVLMVFDAKQ